MNGCLLKKYGIEIVNFSSKIEVPLLASSVTINNRELSGGDEELLLFS